MSTNITIEFFTSSYKTLVFGNILKIIFLLTLKTTNTPYNIKIVFL